MLIIGEGLTLYCVCLSEPTVSPEVAQLSSICGQTEPALRYFALLSGRDTEATVSAVCPDYVCFVV